MKVDHQYGVTRDSRYMPEWSSLIPGVEGAAQAGPFRTGLGRMQDCGGSAQ